MIGFTDQMSDVLAAADALIHSSAGLTVLEAIIRGCPVISYGFGYGHVRASNEALERFGLAQVARRRRISGPRSSERWRRTHSRTARSQRAASTAALILGSDRRVQPLPTWRVRAVRTATAGAASTLVVLAAFLSSVAYGLVSDFGGARAITAVSTPKSQVGVMVDASAQETPELVRELAGSGMHVSVALTKASESTVDLLRDYNDEPLPRLNDSGLVGWVGTKGKLRKLEQDLGSGSHFLYTSSGPSLAQYLLAKGAGGRLVAGKVKVTNAEQLPDSLHRGEVIELRITSPTAVRTELRALEQTLQEHHLDAVPVNTLLQNSGNPV